MGRNRKEGFEYFPCDSSFYDDVKIMRLMKFHTYGGYVYHYLLCQIYRNGYYIDFDDNAAFLVSNRFNIDESDVVDIIQFCMKVGLFDEKLFDENKILTSHGIQKRYLEISQRAKRKVLIERYNLISSSSEENDINSEEKNISSEENDINSEETYHNTSFIPNTSGFPFNNKDKSINILLSNDSVQNTDSGNQITDDKIIPPIREKTDYGMVVRLWHEVCKSYPRVTKLTDKRKKKVDQRMKELDWDYEQLRLIFEKMEASTFMRGGSWASFDWVFTSEGNMTKVLEGNYDDKTGIRTFQQVNKDVNDLWANR